MKSFWGITTYFNPCKYKIKLKNYRKFRSSSKKQGLPLIAVELVFGDDDFELTKDDAEILIQKRCNSDSVMWQKERLLNIALKNLPKECRKVCWIDCDIIFEDDNWVKKTSKLLDKYKAVQPFQYCIRLPERALPKDFPSIWIGNKIKRGFNKRQYNYGFVYLYNKIKNKSNFLKQEGKNYFPGHVWAIQRSIIEKYGFYDKCIIGGGDRVIAQSFISVTGEGLEVHAKLLRKNVKKWRGKMYNAVKGNIFYIPGTIYHFWHGNLKDRRYINRHKILVKYNFNPDKDIKINENGCLEWDVKKKGLLKHLKKYFYNREEEGENDFSRIRQCYNKAKEIIGPKVIYDEAGNCCLSINRLNINPYLAYIFYMGFKYKCPFCRKSFRKFLPRGFKFPVLKEKKIIGAGFRLNCLCPFCLCRDRERLIFLFIKLRKLLDSERTIKLLHVAPEINLRKFIKKNSNVDYVDGDINVLRGKIKMDLRDIKYSDNYFDAIICNHVLEHIKEDRRAISELCRVLKPGGWAILQTPISAVLKRTFEDQDAKTPSERARIYGHEDHVRIYGKDYKNRLEKAGFKVKICRLDENLIKKYALNKEEKIYFCRK